MKTQRIVEILNAGAVDTDVVVKGWVRTKRGNKNVAFIALNDGSCMRNIQVVVDLQKISEEKIGARIAHFAEPEEMNRLITMQSRMKHTNRGIPVKPTLERAFAPEIASMVSSLVHANSFWN